MDSDHKVLKKVLNKVTVLCQTLMDVCSLLPRTHLPTLVVSVVSMVTLIATKELNSFLNPKLPVPIPAELITVSLCHKTHYRTFRDVA